MPKINIKKYSRSNTDSTDPQDTETEIKKSRGRPKKIILETDTENNNIIYRTPEPVQEETMPETIPETVSDTIENVDISDGYIAEIESPSEPFLEELNTTNYIEPPTKEEQKNI